MRIGPFFFDTKEIFLIVAAVLLGVAFYFGWEISLFDVQELLVLVVAFLILKGLLPSIHNEAFFFHALITLFLTLFLPLFQVVLFYFITFIILRMIKVI